MIATKEQERKALEKIRKIISELGEGSYLSTTFEGCFELAEENITNDFAISYKQKYESAVRTNEDLIAKCREFQTERDENQEDIDHLKQIISEKNKYILELEGKLYDAENEAEELHISYIQLQNATDAVLAQHTQKIIELKALLYDRMMDE